jgi:ABC-type Fe3+-hydroxamate transport system substrate-binding protein
MNISNHLLYFVAQSYKQIQLSATKGNEPYPYGEFSSQFAQLAEALGNEDQARQLTTQIIEETEKRKQSVDYVRQQMANAAQPVKQDEPVELEAVLA